MMSTVGLHAVLGLESTDYILGFARLTLENAGQGWPVLQPSGLGDPKPKFAESDFMIQSQPFLYRQRPIE